MSHEITLETFSPLTSTARDPHAIRMQVGMENLGFKDSSDTWVGWLKSAGSSGTDTWYFQPSATPFGFDFILYGSNTTGWTGVKASATQAVSFAATSFSSTTSHYTNGTGTGTWFELSVGGTTFGYVLYKNGGSTKSLTWYSINPVPGGLITLTSNNLSFTKMSSTPPTDDYYTCAQSSV